MARSISRREFVGAVAATSLAGAALAAAPKETGLSSEGLLAGRPGFQPRSVAPLGYKELPGFLSATQLEAHHAEYRRAAEELKATEQALAAALRAPTNMTEYGALRRRQVTLANDVLLHEFYFANLTGNPGNVPAYLRRNIDEHMGSVEAWAEDFTICALSARAWAVLVYDPYDDRWHNTVMDGDNDGVWIGANPLIVCDVALHAYSGDHASREKYVDTFLAHVDWEEVSRRYHRVDRM